MTFRRLMPLSFAFLLPAALAGCAPAHVPWANPAVPKDQWAHDWNACKRQAESDVIGYPSDEESNSPLAAYDRAQAKRQISASVSQCMRDLGYVPARKGD